MRRALVLFLFCAATAIPSPAQTFTKLVDFDGSNGAIPICTLIQASDGNFYGTTFQGGADNYGTVFKVTPEGTLTTLYSFDNVMGAYPFSGVVQGTDGNFYGTSGGGANNSGTVFRITPEGTLTTLYNFCSLMNCADGEGPGALVQGTDGNFYGTTHGGVRDFGTVFKITPEGALTTLHSFEYYTDGFSSAGLVQGTDGNFYGTTAYGGAYLGGTVFKITPEGTLTTLHSFCSEQNCHDGSDPEAVLVQAGRMYGTTHSGGSQRLWHRVQNHPRGYADHSAQF